MEEKMKKGVVLINLGTPDDASVSGIRRYLHEFLLDPRVIDLHAVLRRILVYGLILPFRPFKTSKLYRKIWGPSGSPLRLHTDALVSGVKVALGDDFKVVMAMRYGNPSIASALKAMSDCSELIALPLFPQYSSAATGSAMAKFMVEAAKLWNVPKITVIDKFYNDPGFINPYVNLIRPYLSDENRFLLFSYHGLPERHLDRSHCSTKCNRQDICPAASTNNYFCYRSQCYRTSELLAQGLSLSPERYMTSFQSRLGRIPWIQPYTDEVLSDLRAKGITDLAVACPAFVSDCLETLEEIGMQGRDQWKSLGGKSFTLVPCLNSNSDWVKGVATRILSEINNAAVLVADSN